VTTIVNKTSATGQPTGPTTQPFILLWSMNRVPALIGCGKGGNVTSAGWHAGNTVWSHMAREFTQQRGVRDLIHAFKIWPDSVSLYAARTRIGGLSAERNSKIPWHRRRGSRMGLWEMDKRNAHVATRRRLGKPLCTLTTSYSTPQSRFPPTGFPTTRFTYLLT